MAEEADMSLYFTPEMVPVAELKASEAFASLTDQEKLYAYHIGKAGWEGAKICLLQTSQESPGLFCLLLRVFSSATVQDMRERAAKAGVDSDEFEAFVNFATMVFANLGNYLPFGDMKYVPRLPPTSFEAIVKLSPAFEADSAAVTALMEGCLDRAYSISPEHLNLGIPPEGVSTYYTSNITQADIDLAGRFMVERDLSPYNTRLFKHADGHLEVKLAASATTDHPELSTKTTFEGVDIHVTRGDYAPLMGRVVACLEAAGEVAANDTQKAMLTEFVRSFRDGDLSAHVEGSNHWVKDKGPVVESYLGFIESYQDPAGVRGEWEGFCAVVNRKQSAKFGALVEAAPDLLKLLPWPPAFEKDVFLRPDFTSLEVLAFGSSGIPAGINIPNHMATRQSIGFKNVSLGNVLSARNFKERVTFLSDAHQEAFKSTISEAFEVQVGAHELTGHGSGKVFMKDAEGKLNFEPSATINPLTGEAVSTFYEPGQSYDTVFGSLASSLEECRAECVGLVLCVVPAVLEIFGHTDDAAQANIVHINWLNMVRAGLLGLQYYNPASKAWGQAHVMARYAILRVLLAAGDGFVTVHNLDKLTPESFDTVADDDTGVHVTIDPSKIASVGVPAINDFLVRIQVYKSTADYASAKAMYDEFTSVPDDWLILRDLVIAKRKPRPLFVQPHMTLKDDGSVELATFDPSPDGLIASTVARFPGVDAELEALWRAEKDLH